MDCVILYRVNGGKVTYVSEEDSDDIAVWPNMDAAVDYAMNNKLFNSGQTDHQIIELDEL